MKADLSRTQVIFFQDPGPAEAKLAEIRRAFSAADPGDDAESVFYGDELAPSELVSLCRTPTFLGGRRLALVRRAEKMPAETGREVYEYLARPSPGALVVLMFQQDRVRLPAFSRQEHFFLFRGEEAEMADDFGLANALRRNERQEALRILDFQYRSDDRDFPRLFGMLAWVLRSRVERGRGSLVPATAALFERFYELERDARHGRLGRRAVLELAVIALTPDRAARVRK